MKKILITGAGSYIGESFEKWLQHYEGYQVDTLDMLNPNWKSYDFKGYDVIFHVAGIAHLATRNLGNEEQQKYYKVNRDLTLETARLAKASGVRQFIFMSTMSVYRGSTALQEKKVITTHTKPNPSNAYGKSKLQAEKGLRAMEDMDFRIVILRPPMIYGKGCKGNYQKLSAFSKKYPLFPKMRNKRSMLYISNLCEFVRCVVEKEVSGIYFPQNVHYVNTNEMVSAIAKVNGRTIILSKLLGFGIQIGARIPGKPKELINKVFGSLVYDKSSYLETKQIGFYQVVDFLKSIQETEA